MPRLKAVRSQAEPFIANISKKPHRFHNHWDQARAYPKNSRENYILVPVETANARYLDLRPWYPSKHFKDLFQPGHGIEVMTKEACDWMISRLTQYKEWIVKHPSLERFDFPDPSVDIPFQVADDYTCQRALEQVFGEKGKLLSKFKDFLSRESLAA